MSAASDSAESSLRKQDALALNVGRFFDVLSATKQQEPAKGFRRSRCPTEPDLISRAVLTPMA